MASRDSILLRLEMMPVLTTFDCSGAGIGGLTLAGITSSICLRSHFFKKKNIFAYSKQKLVALSRYPDIEVQIFEAAEKLAEVGAGLGLFPRKCFNSLIILINRKKPPKVNTTFFFGVIN